MKGQQGGFANNDLQIPLEGKLLSIRIEVVTVDLKAYEHYDRQSYAQAVINGTRRKVGWGNSNCFRAEEIGRVSNSKVQHVQSEISGAVHKITGLEHEVFSQNRNEITDEQQTLLIPSAVHKRLECVTTVQNQIPMNKITKILNRIVPKTSSDFGTSFIQSTDSKHYVEQEGVPVDKGSKEVQKKFEKKYSRRKFQITEKSDGNRNFV